MDRQSKPLERPDIRFVLKDIFSPFSSLSEYYQAKLIEHALFIVG